MIKVQKGECDGIVSSVEEYISLLKKINKMSNNQILVYRGERANYGDTAWVPNIFRDQNYITNKNYEMNLYDELYSSGIVGKQSKLETAIDAQHGGFPSRLLDVSYNALVALYFATEGEDFEKSKTNPRVAVFFINEVYTPGSHASEMLFKEVIKENSYYNRLNICSLNHKLIDHTNKNDRIKAQQGAFILFQGKQNRPIPKEFYKIIEIDKLKVYEIQKDLKDLFGITVGKIYPEPHNQIDLVKTKMQYINSERNSVRNEFAISLSNFSRVIGIKMLVMTKKLISDSADHYVLNNLVDKIDEIEEYILSFKLDIKESLKSILVDELDDSEFEFLFDEFVEEYNSLINQIFNHITLNLDSIDVKISDINIFLLNIEEVENIKKKVKCNDKKKY